jgi:hypothetical protein
MRCVRNHNNIEYIWSLYSVYKYVFPDYLFEVNCHTYFSFLHWCKLWFRGCAGVIRGIQVSELICVSVPFRDCADVARDSQVSESARILVPFTSSKWGATLQIDLCDMSSHTFEHFALIPSSGMWHCMVFLVHANILVIHNPSVSRLEVSKMRMC